jgi:hypothetical protein
MADMHSRNPKVQDNMTTKAFYEGREAGYYGSLVNANPYFTGQHADDWIRGYEFGNTLRTATLAELMLVIADPPLNKTPARSANYRRGP